MVAVGGWTFSQGSTKDRFSIMIATSTARSKFITSVKSFIASYKLAGIDIDFGERCCLWHCDTVGN